MSLTNPLKLGPGPTIFERQSRRRRSFPNRFDPTEFQRRLRQAEEQAEAARAQIDIALQEQLIVEYYSK